MKIGLINYIFSISILVRRFILRMIPYKQPA